MGRGGVQWGLPYHLPLLVSILPQQEVDAAEIQVQVCLYAFDLIYLNGEVSLGPRPRQPESGSLASDSD